MKQILQNARNGEIEVRDVPAPRAAKGAAKSKRPTVKAKRAAHKTKQDVVRSKR